MINLILSSNARKAVRALVRGHPDFEAFRLANGAFASRDMTHRLLMAAIETLGLEQEAQEIAYDVDSGKREVPADMDDETKALRPETAGDATAMADTVLNPLRPFLSPTLLDSVDKALAPIVQAALKPAVEIERIVRETVTVDKSGKPVAPAFVPASRVGATTIGKLFGLSSRLKHSDKHISLWDAVDAPDLDPFFVPDVANLAKLVSAIDPALPRKPRNVWLAGPAGSGKSTLPQQIAARAKRPFLRIAFQRAIEPADIIGGNGLVDGATVWVDGVLTKAIRRPGTVILLDEITFAPPGLAAVLQTLLDMRQLTLATGEVVTCADGVVFVCADNTRGYGDESGVYAGTHQSNAAFVDRMARLIVVGYLAPDLEAQALHNHTGAPRPACDRVVAFVNSARKLSGFDAVPLSLRRQVAFVEMCLDGFTVFEAFDDTVLSRLPDAERETIRAHWKADFDTAAFNAEMNNAPVPAAPSADPTQQAARGAFDTVE